MCADFILYFRLNFAVWYNVCVITTWIQKRRKQKNTFCRSCGHINLYNMLENSPKKISALTDRLKQCFYNSMETQD